MRPDFRQHLPLRKLKILLTGASGRVGRALLKQLADYSVIAVTRSDGDLTRPDIVEALCRSTSPDLILNCAAWTDVDLAERCPHEAGAINQFYPGLLGAVAKQLGAIVLHLSTDYVFDGSSNRPYRETDSTAPLSVYGRTKLAGEVALAHSGARHIIVRTSWLYDLRGNDFPSAVLTKAVNGQRVEIAGDQQGSPTWIGSLEVALARIVDRTIGSATARTDPNHFGIFHVACSGSASRRELAEELVRLSGSSSQVEAAPKSSVDPTEASRPMYSVLDSSKFAQTFSLAMPDWRESLKEAMREYESRHRPSEQP